MRRRELLNGLIGALAASAVRARAAGKTYRLAVMSGSQPTPRWDNRMFCSATMGDIHR